ncbi:MAG: serine/threonine-protein kinase [Acidobacteriota bacterium]
MSSDRWPEVRAVLEVAVLLPPEERIAFLDAETTDPDIRAEVEDLLGYLSQSIETFAVTNWNERMSAFGDEARLKGSSIGSYRLIEELGHGGMGAVYLAERADGAYEHRVAVKVLQEGIATPRLAERFREERQILARLSHPGIARLLDGGITPDGWPYLVLEFVDGRTIDRYCEEAKLDIDAKLKLFLKVAEAVQSAHQQFVLHLDLKPANILVTREGEPRLLDFGISRILQTEEDATARSQATLRLMTPRYASPEQAEGAPLGVASDVFSLATLLYRLLTGRLPYTTEDAAPLEVARMIREVAPLAPSEAAPAELKSKLRGDLDTILLQALRKEPERRYPTVAALAADVERHLASEPVLAHADSVSYRLRKFLGRHRIAAPVTAAAIVVLIVSVAAVVRSAVRARRADAVAQRRLHDVRDLAHSYIFDLDSMLEEVPGTIAIRHMVLKNAQSYLEAMSKESADDVDLAHELVEGYIQMGGVQENPGLPSMNDWIASEASTAKAVAIERHLVETHPSDMKERGQLVRALVHHASGPQFLGDLPRVEQIANDAWDTGQPILASGPLPKRYVNMAVSSWTIAILHCGNGDDWNFSDPLGAVVWLDRTEQIAKNFLAAHPGKGDDIATAMLERVAINRASILVQLGRANEAGPFYEEALRYTTPTGNGQLEDETRKQLLGFYASYKLKMNDVHGAEAIAPRPKADSVHEKVHDRQLTADEADELVLLARIDLRLGRVAEGKRKMRQGLDTLEALHKSIAVDSTLGSELAFDVFLLAEESALDGPTRKGFYQRAIELGQEFAAQQPRALSTSMLIGKCRLGLARMARAEHRNTEQQEQATSAAAQFSKILAVHPVQPEASALLVKARALGAS